MSLPRIRYSRLRFYHFVDRNDQELGTLDDVILDINTILPTHLILGGGFFEEYLESKGDIADIDEIAPIDLIDHIDNDYIILNTTLEELETTDAEKPLPVEGYKYSEFVEFPLATSNGNLSGKVFDFYFDQEDSAILAHISSISDQLRSDGYYQSIEFSIPIKNISVQEQTILIDYTTDELLKLVKEKSNPRQNGKSVIAVEH